MGRASDIASALADRAEAVCRHYLSNGLRSGSFWRVGDVYNAKGGSLHVRLKGPRNKIGRWTDEESSQFGDLLDLIRHAAGCSTVRDAMDEAERFLGSAPRRVAPIASHADLDDDRQRKERAARLFGYGRTLGGTLAERYLLARGLTAPWPPSLRYLASAMYQDGPLVRREPAMLAGITTASGRLIGVHRTWVPIKGDGADPARAKRRLLLGFALGGAVHLGGSGPVVLAGEGIETVLSLRAALPQVRLYAALSSSKLGGWPIPQDAAALLIAIDRDHAGIRAGERLTAQARERTLPSLMLWPRRGDFNDDLRAFGSETVRNHVLDQIRARGSFPIELMMPP